MSHFFLGTTDIALSKVILGTWQFGKTDWGHVDDHQSERTIRAALDCGVTTFDTAEEYGAGHSERILGKALAGRRHEAVLLSKVFSDHLRYDQVIHSCHHSLKSLHTDHLDLYQIHWPAGSWGTEKVPIAETLHALSDLRHQGKIRAIGVSNFSLAQVQEAMSYFHLDSIQPPYNLFWRYPESELLPWCREHRVSVLAYSPLAQGILADRFKDPFEFEDEDHRHGNKLFHPDAWPQVCSALDQLRDFAKQRGVTMAQLALAWLAADPLCFPIVGARTPDQIRENSKAMQLELTAEERERINQICYPVALPFLQDGVPWFWEP